ncbi:major facilitator superfamily domain-containing protein [Hyaloscypha sp. PMI_1271]|nr:major facilitator superfamily domain-containing protein [Hyaloscypha sp. PMI_1271]
MQSFLADGPKRDAQTAAYAPLTVALCTFGEFLTGIAWAKVGDRLGPKPTLIIGVVRGSVSALAFGFSTNLWMALSARLFGGLVNPNVGVVSVCVGELVKRKQHRGKGFSVVTFLRGFGSLIGPAICGHLADPVKTLPSIFHEENLWEIFPYLLPNLIVILIITTSSFLGFLFLEESRPQMQNQTDMGWKMSSWVSRKIKSLFGKWDIREFKVGFGMGPPSIASALLTQAIVAILSQVFVVPRVIDRFGPLKTIRWTLFLFPWLYCITPFTARLPYPLSIMAILLDLWTKGILVSLGYVAFAILLTSTVSAPQHLATVNGAAVSIGRLARSIGAAVSGSMFHYSLTSSYIGMPFWTLDIIVAAGAILSSFLDNKL